MHCGGAATSGHGLIADHVFAALRCVINDILCSFTHPSGLLTDGEEGARKQDIPSPLCESDFLEKKVHDPFLFSRKTRHEPHTSEEVQCENARGSPSFTSQHCVKDEDEVKVRVTELFPKVFHAIRYLSGVTETVFADEWLPLSTVNMSLGSGRSNALFFPSRSRLFLCKTIAANEVYTLQRILPSYIDHLQKYPNSFLTRFFLMMKVEVKKEVGFILCFQDVCANAPRVHEKWDLKGRIPKPGKFDGVSTTDGLPDADLFDDNKSNKRRGSKKRNAPERKKADVDNTVESNEGGRSSTVLSGRESADDGFSEINRLPVTTVHRPMSSPWGTNRMLHVSKKHAKNAETTHGQTVQVRKDKNLTRLFWLEPEVRERVLQQLQADYDYLGREGLMDYSLFVAVCRTTDGYDVNYLSTIYRAQSFSGAVEERRPSTSVLPLGGMPARLREPFRETHRKQEKITEVMKADPDREKGNKEHLNVSTSSSLHSEEMGSTARHSLYENADHLPHDRLVSNMSFASPRTAPFNQGIHSFRSQEVYYIGIIDMLTEYNFSKVLANFFKSFLWKHETLSTISPIPYMNRIMRFSRVVFPFIGAPDESSLLPYED